MCFFGSHLPDYYQAFLMSATLSEDVKALKSMVLHNPVSVITFVFLVKYSRYATIFQKIYSFEKS